MPAEHTIAAVIPTYNRQEYIGRAIDSVLSQRRPPDEIVVVDDGSSDCTASVVGQYGERVTYVQKENGGVSSARNLGVRLARSRFIAFLDSDDFWHPDHLERMQEALSRTRGKAGLYFSDLELVPPRAEGSTTWAWSRFGISSACVLEERSKEWLFRDVQPVMIPATVVRRDVYRAVGGCDPRLTSREDTHLFFKIGLSSPLCAVAGIAGVAMGDSPASLTRTITPPNSDAYWQCTLYLYEDVLVRGNGSLCRAQHLLLRRRVAHAHWMLARGTWPHSRTASLAHLGHSTRNHPLLIPSRGIRRLRRVVESSDR